MLQYFFLFLDSFSLPLRRERERLLNVANQKSEIVEFSKWIPFNGWNFEADKLVGIKISNYIQIYKLQETKELNFANA